MADTPRKPTQSQMQQSGHQQDQKQQQARQPQSKQPGQSSMRGDMDKNRRPQSPKR